MCKKIVLMFLIISMVSCTFFNTSYFVQATSKPNASGGRSGTGQSSGDGGSSNYDVGAFESKSSGSAGTSVENFAGSLLYLVKIIAVGVGLIMLAVLAMKYMMSSAQERASIKQSAIVYIVGACEAFGAAGILDIIQNFTTTNLGE